jgi:poly(hydroxyalkanoate) granule-associated protein
MGKNKKRAEKELKASMHRIWQAGLGALSAAEEGGSKLFQVLAERGQELEKGPVTEAKKKVKGAVKIVRDRAGKTLENFDSSIDKKILSALKKMGVPTQNEITKLKRKVDRLAEMIEKQMAGKKKTTKKAAKKSTKKATKKTTKKSAKKSAGRKASKPVL